MSAVNASFAKLLEYEERATGFDTAASDSEQMLGDWIGVAFRIGETKLACSIDRVHEFLPLPGLTRVPGTQPFILGLANLRGDLITVIDLACYLTGERSTITMRSRLLAASLRGRPVGLLVDEVYGQKHFVTGDSRKPALPKGSPLEGLVNKQHRSGTENWQELDLDILFSSPKFLNGAAA